MLQFLAAYNTVEKKKNYRIWIQTRGPSGSREAIGNRGSTLGKSSIPTWLAGLSKDVEQRPTEQAPEAKRNEFIIEEEITPTWSYNYFQSPTFSNSPVFHRGSEDEPWHGTRSQSWKRQARRRNLRMEETTVGGSRVDERIF